MAKDLRNAGLAGVGDFTHFVPSVTPTAGGGFAFTGRGASEGGWNALLLQVDATGELVSERDFGGERDDCGNSIEQTADGGFIVSATSRSFTAPDVYDNQVYLIKTAPEEVPAPIFRRGDCNSDGGSTFPIRFAF